MSSPKSSNPNPTNQPPTLPVGSAAGRELRRLLKNSQDPVTTIQTFQHTHSLHSMLSRSFGTTPHDPSEEAKNKTRSSQKQPEKSSTRVEPFRPEPVLKFLGHLGVTQHEVHSRITLALRHAVDLEIHKKNPNTVEGREALLNLLKACWTPANAVSDLRPVLVAVIRRLGEHTPLSVLQRLGEKDEKSGEGGLKYEELWSALDWKMRRLIWEADWGEGAEGKDSGDGNSLLERLILPAVKKYCEGDEVLKKLADLAFVTTVSERKTATLLRRGLGGKKSTTSISSKDKEKENKERNSVAAISKIKQIVGDRPKLLGGVMNIIMTMHAGKKNGNENVLVGGSNFLTCTLALDVLLSYGQLPRSYENIGILANILDDTVKAGILSDDAIAQIQGCLRSIFQSDATIPSHKPLPPPTTTTPNILNSSFTGAKRKYSLMEDAKFAQNLLSQVVRAAMTAMKHSDPQTLFLNPVNDAIAPGYSSIITRPMCIITMEKKIANNKYPTLTEFDKDVSLMFQNCIAYNIGKDGLWFRGEARRQHKIFKDDILPQGKTLWRKGMTDRRRKWEKGEDERVGLGPEKKRKREDEKPTATSKKKTPEPNNAATKGTTAKPPVARPPPMSREESLRNSQAKFRETLQQSSSTTNTSNKAISKLTSAQIVPIPGTKVKKRKKDNDIPSFPAIASMLLADPFVVRIIIDKLIRSLRVDVLKTKSVPALHPTIPSVLQLLRIAQYSTSLCATRKKKFFVPDSGLERPVPITIFEESSEEKEIKPTKEDFVPYTSLRKYIPLMCQLMLQSNLDYRTVIGGELHDAALSPNTPTKPTTDASEWEGAHSSSHHIHRAMLQMSVIRLLIPGNSNGVALLSQLPQFLAVLEEVTPKDSTDNQVNDMPFWRSLTGVLLRHRQKLSHGVRDWIVRDWMCKWLRHSCRVSGVKEALNSVLHQRAIRLLNEWAALGNVLLPRDALLEFSVEIAMSACGESKDTFAAAFFGLKKWKKRSALFLPVKEQYERMFKSLPEGIADQWKEKMDMNREKLDDSEKMVDADGENKQGNVGHDEDMDVEVCN